MRLLVLAILCCSALWGCVEPSEEGELVGITPSVTPPPVVEDTALTASDVPSGLKALRFGVTPYLDPKVIRTQYTPIAEYLSKHLEFPVELVITSSYQEQIEKVVRGDIDVVSLSPLSYVLAKQRAPKLQIIASELAKGNTGFSSFLIVKVETNYKSLSDLKGARIVFVDEHSTSGFLFPYAAFLDAGLDPERHFSEVRFAGSHLKAVFELATGQADVAATGSGMLEQAGLHEYAGGRIDVGALRILRKVGRIPYDAVSVREGFPQSGVKKITAAFCALSTRTREGWATLAGTAGINAFVPAKDVRYDVVRDTLKKVEVHRAAR